MVLMSGSFSRDPGHIFHLFTCHVPSFPTPKANHGQKDRKLLYQTRLIPNSKPTKSFLSQSLIKSVLKQNEVII